MATSRSRNLKSFIAMLMAGLLVMSIIGPASAEMQEPTGNPQADGWVSGGNSLDSDVFVTGTGAFAYEIYTTAFTLEAGSSLLGDGWNTGDQVVGLGGFIDPEDNNPNLTHSVRIVSKFSSGYDSWSAPGTGSFSEAGGDGALLLATHAPLSPPGNTEHLNPFAGYGSSRVATELVPGEIHEIPLLQRRVSGSTLQPGTEAGKFIYLSNGPDFVDTSSGESAPLLSSWQVFVNVSMLDDEVAPIPEEGHNAVQSLQRSTGVFTDGLVVIEAPDLVDPQPEARSDCMRGGWEDFGFKNQGQCIASVQSNENSRH